MFTIKNYSNLSLEELKSEENKLKSYKIPIALLCGFLMGVAIWSATHQWGFFKTVMLMAFSFFVGNKYSQTLKEIQAEINTRNHI